MRKPWRPDMPALLPPPRMRQCSGLSRSFLRGPDGPCGDSTRTSPALRRSYRAKETAGQNKIRITKVSTVLGEPRRAYWLGLIMARTVKVPPGRHELLCKAALAASSEAQRITSLAMGQPRRTTRRSTRTARMCSVLPGYVTQAVRSMSALVAGVCIRLRCSRRSWSLPDDERTLNQ
jgi:hypothetical protein